MRVCQRCGAETDEPRCPSCGYTSFIELEAATERPAPTPPPEPTEPDPEAPLPIHLQLARRRGWWALGLLLFSPLCNGVATLLTWLVPTKAAGCLPLTISFTALVFATIGYLGQVPLLCFGLVMGVLAVLAWRRPTSKIV